MASPARLKLKVKFDFRGLRAKSKRGFDRAREKGALALLDWTANGSSAVPEKAPIDWGVLRASGSAFVGNKKVGDTKSSPVREGTPTPNESYTGKPGAITIGYNTDYAARMHFAQNLKPGPASLQAGNSNPGNHWLLKHLKGDGKLLMDVIARSMRKEF